MTTSTLSTSTSSTGMSGPSTLGTETSCDPSAAQVRPGQGREPGRWTASYFAPAGRRQPESGHRNLHEATGRMHRPDGGHHDPYCNDPHRHDPRCLKALDRAKANMDRLGATIDRLRATAIRWRPQGRAHRVRELQRRMGRR